jgi:hypothetical protein
MIKTEVRRITPEDAGKMLAKNSNNRKLDPRIVDMIAGDIEAGRWQMNGDTIKLNGDRLLDGQHRLHAIIKANKPVETLVVSGLDSSSFATIDTNRKKRSTSQVLDMAGEEYTSVLAAAIRIYHDVNHNPSKWKRSSDLLSQQYFVDFLEQHPDIRHSVQYISGMRHLVKLCGAAIPAGMHYLFTLADPERADEFMNDLNNGIALSPGDPVHVLRQRLIDNKGSRTKTERTVIMAYFIKAWNYRCQGREVARLLWRPEVEDFPVIFNELKLSDSQQ